MESFERFAELLSYGTLASWRDQIFRLGLDFGYEQTLLAILPDPNAPVEPEYAFVHSNYSAEWRKRYDEERLQHIDPTFTHCVSKTIPLIWAPEIFSDKKQKEMYEEACGYGIKSGVTLPIHGAGGELGLVCFVNDVKPNPHFKKRAIHSLSELSCFRDFIFESSLKFIKPPHHTDEEIHITSRELECLKWSAAGKNSWEIGYLLNCTEATVNFHFKNIRLKFNTKSRQQALVRAINLGLINPS